MLDVQQAIHGPLESTFLDDFCGEQPGVKEIYRNTGFINMICFGVDPALTHPIWMEKMMDMEDFYSDSSSKHV